MAECEEKTGRWDIANDWVAKLGRNFRVTEHTHLIEAVRAGKPFNELKSVAESTLTAIMGCMSTYTGKAVTWEQALNSEEKLVPAELQFGPSMAVPPVPVPGRTKLA